MIEYHKNLNLQNLPYVNEEGLICWEEFKGIPDYEGVYQISDLGRVKSVDRVVLKNGKYPSNYKGTILKISIGKNGYAVVSLCKDGNCSTKKIHQLVTMAFLNHIPCGFDLVVNHKNFIRHDNCLLNLEIITPRENGNQLHIKSSSDFGGVTWHKKRKKWNAQIEVEGKKKHLGTFDDEIEASKYYDNALKALKNGENILVKLQKFSSQYIGVSWCKKYNKWKAEIYINKKCKFLGYFNVEKEASEAYLEAKVLKIQGSVS